jgi:hypothetical protein
MSTGCKFRIFGDEKLVGMGVGQGRIFLPAPVRG